MNANVEPYCFEIIVRFADTDAAGITYFANYPSFFDESFIDSLRKAGMTWEKYHENDFMIPIVEQNTKYHSPLKAGDKIKIYSVISEISNRSMSSKHAIVVKGDGKNILAATGWISRVCVDLKFFKPKPIPEMFRTILESLQMTNNEWDEFIINFA